MSNLYDTPFEEDADIFDAEPIDDELFLAAKEQKNPPKANTAGTDIFEKYLKTFPKTPLLTAEEEKDLARKVQSGGQSARDKLVTSNLLLVVKIAKRHCEQGVPFLDLIQEGNIGLMIAVRKFDPERGFRFSTYATWWIQQSIMRHIKNSGRTIRAPVHAVQKLYKHKKLAAKLGRGLTDREITDNFGDKDASKFDDMLERLEATNVLSLEALAIGDAYNGDWSRIVPETKPGPEDICAADSDKMFLLSLLSKLKPREREIVMLRYGINGDTPHTLQEVSAMFSVTRERIRQIEKAALKKLKLCAQKAMEAKTA